jgi:hypothetical protein
MKKTLIASIVGLVSLGISHANVTISDFSSLSIAADSPWSWNSGTKSLTITSPNSSSGSLYQEITPALNINGGINTQLSLTLGSLITSNPGGGFFISLESTGGGIAQASFNWVEFTLSTSVTKTWTENPGPTFNPASVTYWNIFDGGAGGSGGLPATEFVSLQAVPEPSTYALMALGGLVLFFMVRRRKVQA